MSERFPPDQVLERAPDAVWREVDGRAAVISLDGGRIRTLNPVGTLVWSLLDGRPVAALREALAERYPEVAADELARDLDAFLDDLTRRGLVRPADAP
ncbi:MAG TPA: PqqD family protein [Polyangiaceae bacterium]|nr:PqqD family protein [Polyangiaceae bacterium]